MQINVQFAGITIVGTNKKSLGSYNFGVKHTLPALQKK
jgi:hypothetical protein